jgi:hypothetical protein
MPARHVWPLLPPDVASSFSVSSNSRGNIVSATYETDDDTRVPHSASVMSSTRRTLSLPEFLNSNVREQPVLSVVNCLCFSFLFPFVD